MKYVPCHSDLYHNLIADAILCIPYALYKYYFLHQFTEGATFVKYVWFLFSPGRMQEFILKTDLTPFSSWDKFLARKVKEVQETNFKACWCVASPCFTSSLV